MIARQRGGGGSLDTTVLGGYGAVRRRRASEPMGGAERRNFADGAEAKMSSLKKRSCLRLLTAEACQRGSERVLSCCFECL